MVHENTPSSTNLLPVGIEINADTLDDLRAAFQHTHNITEWLPPVFKIVFPCILRDAIEFEAEGFDLLLPAPKGDHKVTLAGKLNDTRV
jgi:hypothetical protein